MQCTQVIINNKQNSSAYKTKPDDRQMFISRLQNLKISHLCGKNEKNVVLSTDTEKSFDQTHNILGLKKKKKKNLEECLSVDEELTEPVSQAQLVHEFITNNSKKARYFSLTALFSIVTKVLLTHIHIHILAH